MIRLTPPSEKVRRPLREVLGMPPSSGSKFGSTRYKRWNVCPRAGRLYDLGVRRQGSKTEGLDFGDAFHLVLEGYYRSLQAGVKPHEATKAAWDVLKPLRDADDYADMLTDLERVLTSYFEFAENDQWDVIAVEEELTYLGLGFDYSARLDLVVKNREDGMMYVVEHKSAKVITDDMTQGYMLDQQTLGQAWLMATCVDLAQYPPFGGVLVNITSKQKMPKHVRVHIPASQPHLREFEKALTARARLNEYAASLGYPKMLGNCSGAAQYFSACSYFDICHGQPDFDIAGLDKLTPSDLPFGFTVVDDDGTPTTDEP